MKGLNLPIQIKENIYWVGEVLENDQFQCHVYLIENGNNSILIDPGSNITFHKTLEKIEHIIPFKNIKYIICHHQDPDITASLKTIEKKWNRKDGVVLSHWRAIALIKHYDLNLNIECVEKNNWEILAGDRRLKFIFTPYLHFAGAFCTYDEKSKILFSSDIFGGFTEKWSLFAKDESYFDAIAKFHSHYMPSKEILQHTLEKFEKLEIDIIAPQHGSIIRKPLIKKIISKLKDLDCGIFLLTETSTEIQRLRILNDFLKNLINIIASYTDLNELIKSFSGELSKIIKYKDLNFYIFYDNEYKTFNSKSPTVWEKISKKEDFLKYLNITIDKYLLDNNFFIIKKNNLLIPFIDKESRKIIGFLKIESDKEINVDKELERVLFQISNFLSVAIQRELKNRQLIKEKNIYYNISIKDQLTKCYTRYFLMEVSNRFFSLHDRDMVSEIGAIMIDIDDFKHINDTYGHDVGDKVLSKIAEVIIKVLRQGDIIVRYGGEEFLILLIIKNKEDLIKLAERIREAIENIKWESPIEKEKITISLGVAMREKNESLEELIKKADIKLYEAKRSGKNRVCY